MRLFKIITHPVLLISIFLVLIINGENWGGVYLWYLLLALPHGAVHSLFAVLGCGLIVYSYARYERKGKYLVGPLLNLAGLLFLLLSVFYFFYNDKSNYNISTFEGGVPLFMMGLFGILSLLFAIDNVVLLFAKERVLK